MFKILKMISLLTLAVAASEPSLDIPPHILLANSPLQHVTVSAYTNHPSCTASKRNRTASSLRITEEHYGKMIALSRDIGADHSFGDEFSLWVNGKLYQVSYEDRMPKKHHKKVDLLLDSLGACRQFGRHPGILVPMDKA
jgi:hypothetical protein